MTRSLLLALALAGLLPLSSSGPGVTHAASVPAEEREEVGIILAVAETFRNADAQAPCIARRISGWWAVDAFPDISLADMGKLSRARSVRRSREGPAPRSLDAPAIRTAGFVPRADPNCMAISYLHFSRVQFRARDAFVFASLYETSGCTHWTIAFRLRRAGDGWTIAERIEDYVTAPTACESGVPLPYPAHHWISALPHA